MSNNESTLGKEQFGGQKAAETEASTPPSKPFLAGSPLDKATLLEKIQTADQRAKRPIKLAPDGKGVTRLRLGAQRIDDSDNEGDDV